MNKCYRDLDALASQLVDMVGANSSAAERASVLASVESVEARMRTAQVVGEAYRDTGPYNDRYQDTPYDDHYKDTPTYRDAPA